MGFGINILGWQVVGDASDMGGSPAEAAKHFSEEWEAQYLEPYQAGQISTEEFSTTTAEYYQGWCVGGWTNPAFDKGLAFLGGGIAGGTSAGMALAGGLQLLGYEEDGTFSVSGWLADNLGKFEGSALLCGLWGPFALELVEEVKAGKDWEEVEPGAQTMRKYLMGDGPNPATEAQKTDEMTPQEKKAQSMKKKAPKTGPSPVLAIGAIVLLLWVTT